MTACGQIGTPPKRTESSRRSDYCARAGAAAANPGKIAPASTRRSAGIALVDGPAPRAGALSAATDAMADLSPRKNRELGPCQANPRRRRKAQPMTDQPVTDQLMADTATQARRSEHFDVLI